MSMLEGLSLVEWMILSFIGVNLTLSGAYLIQCGVRRIAAPVRE